MKTTILIGALLVYTKVFALPVLNLNVATTPLVTIYPDHQDPQQFYVAPNSMSLAQNEQGVPLFSYAEYKHALFDKRALVQSIFIPTYKQADLEEAKAQILTTNPNAQFSSLAFLSSEMVFLNPDEKLIDEQLCNHAAGLVGQEQTCSFRLSHRGRKFFGTILKNRNLMITLHFQYKITGVIQNADNTYSNQEVIHGVAAYIDGSHVMKYPDIVHFLK